MTSFNRPSAIFSLNSCTTLESAMTHSLWLKDLLRDTDVRFDYTELSGMKLPVRMGIGGQTVYQFTIYAPYVDDRMVGHWWACMEKIEQRYLKLLPDFEGKCLIPPTQAAEHQPRA